MSLWRAAAPDLEMRAAPVPFLESVPDLGNCSLMRELGKFITAIGLVTTLLGLVMWGGFIPKWLGRLPGDIRIEREHSAFYFPIVTCIVLSVALSLLLSIFSLFRR